MRLNITSLILLLIAALGISSCGTSKSTVETPIEALPYIEKDVLLDKLTALANDLPDHFFTKMNAKYSDIKNNLSFKTSVTMVVDSALQANITFANIPIYSAVISPDSLKLLDRRAKCYLVEGLDFIKHQFNVDFSHKNIEELLMGLPIAWDASKTYYQLQDAQHYVIASHEESVVNAPAKTHDYIIRYYLDSEVQQIEKIYIDSPKDTTSIRIVYENHEAQEGYNLPKSVRVNIKTVENDIFADFKYTKVEINDPRALYLTIPEKYEQCE